MRKDRRRIRPALDVLEDRRVLSTSGNAWFDPSHLTLSFAPDGTRDGLATSSLHQSLDGLNTGGNDWQVTMLRAFQTWEAKANVNIGLVGDGGQDFGAAGAVQGDARFGDIRIGSIPQTTGTLALTQPVGYAAGTWAGDVNLNSSTQYGINDPNAADLFTVALHEAGHVLGLDDNTDTSSVMFDSYAGARTAPSAADVAALQALYGARPADGANTTFANASNIAMVSPTGANAGSSLVTIVKSLSTPTSAHYYTLTPGSDPGATSFQLKTSGISMLQATLTVYDASHKVIGTATAADPRSGDLTVTLPSLAANATYYVSVTGARGDAFSLGNYQLRAIPNSVLSAKAAPSWSGYSSTNGFNNLDNGTNDSLSAATSLLSRGTRVGTTNYFYAGSLSTATDVDFYSFTTPGSTQNVLTVAAWGMQANPVDANLTVYDSAGRPVPATVITHAGTTNVIQVANVTPNATYFVRASAYTPGSTNAVGNYGLAVAFGTTVEAQTQLGSGTLNPNGNLGASAVATIAPPHDTLYNFNLAADNGGLAQDFSAQMTITDANGVVVATLQARANQAQSLQVWLKAGTYTVSIAGRNNAGSSAAPLKWTLACELLSDPIKVYTSSGSGGTLTPR